ncbi:MAG: hypothetical protein ABF673_08680 [Acetobacter persici]
MTLSDRTSLLPPRLPGNGSLPDQTAITRQHHHRKAHTIRTSEVRLICLFSSPLLAPAPPEHHAPSTKQPVLALALALAQVS